MNDILPKAIKTSFIALLPKMTNPQILNEVLPICLVGSVYRILEKCLAERLKKVIGILVSPCQSTFMQGRQMLDRELVLNALANLAKGKKRIVCCLKLISKRRIIARHGII